MSNMSDGWNTPRWDLELGTPTQQTELDLPRSDMVRINDMAPVMRAAGNGIELAQMNFSFAPSGPKGGPVFKKTKHRFSLIGAPFHGHRRAMA